MLPLNTVTVGAAVTPAVVGTWFSHYANRRPRREKPTAHISYDLGLHLVRRFIDYSAFHTIEELQSFTGQWVPAPRWVRAEEVEIPQADITKAAKYLQSQLGPDGIEQVGGKQWWQWRRDNHPLKAEWIEMRKDYNDRKEKNDPGHRVMLYVHGGAYYFGSVDEHRYQIQRHARKLKAKCLAPRYRLAPQFPFPCGLHDCLSAYLYLLSQHDHTEIIVAGDSAGGGMVLSMLVVLRDQGIPLPAGGILLSPWVDLTHSFPSICGDGSLDYIPSDGFIHKPSMGWPPPSLGDIKEGLHPTDTAAAQVIENAIKLSTSDSTSPSDEPTEKERERGYSVSKADTADITTTKTTSLFIAGRIPSVTIDGKMIQIHDQIQIYATNELLTHPLVSPILQPSLGGLPPLLIQTGGGEMLRDEQLYLAHKAASPARYPPNKATLARYDPDGTTIRKYKPTDVQVQLWEDLCHVGHTLSWTRPAKFMYRSVAQFGAWALAHAQQRAIDIPDDESDLESSSDSDDVPQKPPASGAVPKINTASVGKAGDPLPPFKNHMIRQRVDRHGSIFALDAESDLEALSLDSEDIGVLKEGPVRKWLARQDKWNKKFASTKRAMQKKRAKQIAQRFGDGEKPPPTALAGMKAQDLPTLKKITKGYGMMMWGGWGSKHDQIRVQHDRQAGDDEQVVDEGQEQPASRNRNRSRSSTRPRSRSVLDEGQANGSTTPNAKDINLAVPSYDSEIGDKMVGNTLIPATNTTSTRPTADGIAYPFKLKVPEEDVRSTNASMMTLDSAADARSPLASPWAATFGDTATSSPLASPLSPGADFTASATPAGRPGIERFETAREDL